MQTGIVIKFRRHMANGWACDVSRGWRVPERDGASLEEVACCFRKWNAQSLTLKATNFYQFSHVDTFYRSLKVKASAATPSQCVCSCRESMERQNRHKYVKIIYLTYNYFWQRWRSVARIRKRIIYANLGAGEGRWPTRTPRSAPDHAF